MRCVCFVVCAFASIVRAAEPVELTRPESDPRPAPAWVKMVDLGASDPALKGYRAPAGVKVEVVASEPTVINPVAMRFRDDGSLLVIEWNVGTKAEGFDTTVTFKDGSTRPVHQWVKDVPDTLKVLTDTNGDGTFEKSSVVYNDLRLPASVLEYDGWTYFTMRGSVVRRKPGVPDQRIATAFCGFNQHQLSGLTLSADGWLYLTSGDDDNHPEGADGTRLHLLRTGGVWRIRPDGSQLSLYARGFRNPYRDVAIDPFGNVFHLDNDNEDGSKFTGCRLIHVLEEADYGWRLKPGVRCCWPDHDLGAVWGERPGKMTPMLKTGRGAPCGLLIYQGNAFPEFFQGLLIYPDVFQRNVRAYKIERDGCTFKVTQQFTLLETDDGLFRPDQALVGPDGAIYLSDWRTNSAGPAAAWGDEKHGRIWRLSWSGTADVPAIARGAMDAWTKLAKADDATLGASLDNADAEIRTRAVTELLKRDYVVKGLCRIATDRARPPHARAAALSGAARRWGADVADASLNLLIDQKDNPELRKLAAELLGRNGPVDLKTANRVITVLRETFMRDTEPAPVRRAAALAAATLATQPPANAGYPLGVQGSLMQTYSQLSAVHGDAALRDGIVRALERFGRAGVLSSPMSFTGNADDINEARVTFLEMLRTHDGVEPLARALSESDRFTEAQTIRLLTAFRFFQTEPPIDATPLTKWLQTHQRAPAAMQIAALESIAALGDADASRVMPAVLQLIENSFPELRIAAYNVIGKKRWLAAAKPLAKSLKDSSRSAEERRAIIAALANLRGEHRFAQLNYDPGVLGVTDDLAFVVQHAESPAIVRGDALKLLAQLDFPAAKPLAEAMLASKDADAVAAGIIALSGDMAGARDVGKRFIEGKIDRAYLPQVAAALNRHATTNPDIAALRAEVLKKGLSLAADPDGLKRIEALVKSKGSVERGRAVFLDATKSTCITCHSMNGAGGHIGPDLTGIAKNATVAKLIESVVEPSKEIKEGFEQYVVQTKAGQTYAGYKAASDATRIVLRDPQGNDVVIPADQVKREVKSKTSLMPEGAYALLSLDEFVDLIAFLAASNQ